MPDDFNSLVNEIRAADLHKVNAREWSVHWEARWIAYADLIGFAYRCEKSSQAQIVKTIFGFHRAVQSASANVGSVRLHQFTDAAFAISDSCESVIKFASQLQHHCLAHNAAKLQDGQVSFNDMLVPRITIARGRIFQLPDRLGPSRDLAGIAPAAVLAGAGIVSAYRIEKATGGTLISISEGDSQQVRQIELKRIRGEKGVRATLEAFTRWQEDETFLTHDRVADFPWILIKPKQPGDRQGFWVDTIKSLKSKLQTLIQVWELDFREFVIDRSPIEAIKHYGAVQRHLVELIQAVLGLKRARQGSMAELLDDIERLKI